MIRTWVRCLAIAIAIALGIGTGAAQIQISNRWMNAGALHNWYSSMGCENENGRVMTQQDGLRWPAVEPYRDAQAARGLWLGTRNWTDGSRNWPFKVVHVGPRSHGIGEFYPMRFERIARWAQPQVRVNGIQQPVDSSNGLDPSMPWDMMLLSWTNTAIGVTVQRRIMQFSHPLHDNYILEEYEFVNTGNVDDDPTIELPTQVIDSLYAFYQYRWAPCLYTRYAIGNPTGWGINTMLDTRGDGVLVDPPDQRFRAQYGWHARFPGFTYYDNVGAPLWSRPSLPRDFDPADTVGRLGAPQFVGVVTLHADRSASDTTDAPLQPATTRYVGSDDLLNYNNSQFDQTRMEQEYRQWMSAGHMSPRHWDLVGPNGDPALGTSGGYSAANGYGPYRLAPGDGVRIVTAVAAAGLSRERSLSVGSRYKRGEITAGQKNDSVYSGRDSLFQTFRRAIANRTSGYLSAPAIAPPAAFTLSSNDSSVSLTWGPPASGPPPDGYRIYRSTWRAHYTAALVRTAGPGERSFTDANAPRSIPLFYYVTAYRDSLESGRYYTQTTTPIHVGPPVGVGEEQGGVPLHFALHQNYPNPFNPLTTIRFDLPEAAHVTLKVYDLLGRQVAMLKDEPHDAGEHSVRFDASGLASGIYYYRISAAGRLETRKMMVVR